MAYSRKEKKLSQADLGKLSDINGDIIGKYEREEVKPTVDVVKNLAEVLDTTIGFLLGET